MLKNPDHTPEIIIPSEEAVRAAVRKMEADYQRDITRLRELTPSWSPLMDRIIIGVPGQLPPEELKRVKKVSKPKPQRIDS